MSDPRRQGGPPGRPRATLTWLVFAVLLIALASTPVAAQPLLPPVDEAASRPDFFSFRAQLQAAVARRDAPAVLAVVSRDVKSSFGGDTGLEAFRKKWALEEPDSPLWETLATVLALGGTFGPGDTFTAPYVFSRWPEDADAFSSVAVIGTGVRVRAQPRDDAPAVATVSFAILEVNVAGNPDEKWMQVRAPGGRNGYIDRRYVRSPIDYRAIFARVNGRWWLQAFVAGD